MKYVKPELVELTGADAFGQCSAGSGATENCVGNGLNATTNCTANGNGANIGCIGDGDVGG